MAFKKIYLLYGAGALVALVGGYFIYENSTSPTGAAANSGTDSSTLGSVYPDTIYGGGSSGTTTTDTSGTDTLSALLAQQTTQSTQNYQLGEDTLASQERVSLATLDTQKAIALDTNQANIEQSLAGQLGSIVQAMTPSYYTKYGKVSPGLAEVAGGIGFSNGQITLDLGASHFATVNGQAAQVVGGDTVNQVKQSPLLNNNSVASAIANVGK